ncbi:MAG: hypothetical protein QW465_00910 [Candidatus Anstonellales archaeon]
MITNQVLVGSGAAVIAGLIVVINSSYRIPEIKVIDERATGLVIEYTYPRRDNRNYLLGLITSGSSILFKKEKGDWNSYSNNVIIMESRAPFNLSGKSFLPFSAPNSHYMIVKNNIRRTFRVRERYHEYQYSNFRLIAESERSEDVHRLLTALDKHITKLASDTRFKLLPFDVILVDLPIPSVILNDNRMVVGNKDRFMELLHEFSHVISMFNNHNVLEASLYLYRNPHRFAESKYFDTKVGHPHTNISEMIASIITLYIAGKDPELSGKDREMFQIIISHYRLDELRGEISGIIGKRE